MQIRVEFFGLARRWAEATECEVVLPSASPATLQAVLNAVAEQLPAFRERCLSEGQLHPALAANVSGERFVRHPQAPLAAGESLLLLSADAGG
jgi:molybdopterin converting factor small subunit